MTEQQIALSHLERQRLEAAYGSTFYRELVKARQELAAATRSVDQAITTYQRLAVEELPTAIVKGTDDAA